MKPIQFDGCVGWLYEGHTEYGVVLCEPLGHEALWTHKLLRALAEHLVREGISVLRFNYPCAGESAGEDSDNDRFSKTLACVRSAIDVLRTQANACDVTLLGVRAGAMFAMLAAAGEGGNAAPHVDAVVALAPIVRGRAYLRELSLIRKGWLETAPQVVRRAVSEEGCMSVLGHCYPPDLVDQIKAVNLCDVANTASSLARSVLLVDTDYGESPALKTTLQTRGIDVATARLPDWSNLMLDSAHSRLPLEAIDSVTRWIIARSRFPVPNARPHPTIAAEFSTQDSLVNAVAEGVEEQVVWIGPDRLVGTLCSPAETDPVRPGVPAWLIANTAANPRMADGRFAVRLAREMARYGVVTLRVDVSGVGDSGEHGPDDQSGVLYSDQTITDMASAANWLAARGHQEVIAFGICSGGYAALHAAMRASSLAGVVAINLPRFVWPTGLTVAEATRQRINSSRGYLASARSWRKWTRLLRERRDLRPIARILARSIIARFRLPTIQIAERLGWRPAITTERGVMQELNRRGVATLLVYGEFDPGINELHRHFGRTHQAFDGWRHVRVETVAQLDHALFGISGRNAVMDLCVQMLTHWSERKAEVARLCCGKDAGPRRKMTSAQNGT
ncbi:alpha/beta hydrolase [Paraburkholderia sp. MMS20-SJTR3]|uniref:Alpha/beta hydrolase n=1 Tax=Paraburkholderia sejongensis TaxID=2886946 RepID=A0ABS8K678_9BURK|nr:alpha/beta hydrolase [Paraburkholderia sp. MMS20-SJTR3]MCC8397656.1 alpha/beta hydrolase [Paraburkholderia sp. MMS20-SJTR3]